MSCVKRDVRGFVGGVELWLATLMSVLSISRFVKVLTPLRNPPALVSAQPAEQPDQQDDGEWNPDQPKQ